MRVDGDDENNAEAAGIPRDVILRCFRCEGTLCDRKISRYYLRNVRTIALYLTIRLRRQKVNPPKTAFARKNVVAFY